MQAISKIVLGTVQLGLNYGINNSSGKPGKTESNKILDFAFAKGIRLLDTAEAYGDSQEVIGDYHKNSQNKFDVITKLSSKRIFENLTSRVVSDLSTLNASSLYCYMFHSYGDFKLYYNGYKKEIGLLKDSGVISKIGVSIYTNEEMDDLLGYDVDLIQLPFSLLDNHAQRGDLIKKAKDKGKEIHTRSAFLQGLFFKEVDHLPDSLIELAASLNSLKDITKRYNITMANLALSYVTQQREIDKILIGVESVEQLEQNINSLSYSIPDEAVKEIDRVKVGNIQLLNPAKWEIK
jgi:aryl-alcohol dehydrogenase-like predicted oxidoreductase